MSSSASGDPAKTHTRKPSARKKSALQETMKFYAMGGLKSLPSTESPLYRSLRNLPLAEPETLSHANDPVEELSKNESLGAMEKRARIAETRLELLHTATVQCIGAALSSDDSLDPHGDVLFYLGEIVEKLQEQSFESSEVDSLKMQNKRHKSRIADLELVMKFQLQSLNDVAKNDEAIVNQKIEVKNIQLTHEEEMAKKEVAHKEALDRLDRQIELLRLENKKLKMARVKSTKSTAVLKSKPSSRLSPNLSPSSSHLSVSSSSFSGERIPSMASLGGAVSSRNLSPNRDRVEVKAFAEFLHTFRLYRILPLARESADSTSESTGLTISKFEMNADPSGGGKVNLVQGQLDDLVDLLFVASDSPLKRIFNHTEFMRAFVYTFPCFTTSEALMEKLLVRYRKIVEVPDCWDLRTKFAFLDVVRTWIRKDNGRDFESPEMKDLLNQVVDLELNGIMAPRLVELPLHLRAVQEEVTLKNPTTVPSLIDGKVETLLDVPAAELARQLTLVEADLLNKVNTAEFLDGAWYSKSPPKETLAPNLLKLIAHGNRITALITTEVLRHPNAKDRADALGYFIHVSENLRNMNNFNGLIQVLSSLHSATLSKLKSSWEQLGKKERELFDSVTDLMSTSYHYKKYHSRVHALDDATSVIPLISVVCAELFNTNDAMENVSEAGPDWINWDKMQVVGDRIHEIKRFGYLNYGFQEIFSVRKLLETAEAWEDDDIAYEIAAIRENAPVEGLKLTSTSDLWQSSELTDRDWHLFLTGTRPLTFSKDEVVLNRGQLNKHLYRIQKGTVRVEVLGPNDSTPIVVAQMGAGEIFGEISLVLRDVQGATTAAIIADSHCEIYKLEIDFVLEICRNQPSTSAALNLFLAKKLANRLKTLSPKKKSHSEEDTDTAASEDTVEDLPPKRPKGKKSRSVDSLMTNDKRKRLIKSPRVEQLRGGTGNQHADTRDKLQVTAQLKNEDSLWVNVRFEKTSNLRLLDCINMETSKPFKSYRLDLTSYSTCPELDWPKSAPFRFTIPSYRYTLRVSSLAEISNWKLFLSRVYGIESVPISPRSGSPPTSPRDSDSEGSLIKSNRTKSKKGKKKEEWASSFFGKESMMTERDVKFNKLFHLTGQVVLREFPCTFKKKSGMKASGMMYVSQECIAFSAVSFGFKSKEVVPFQTITEVVCEMSKKIEKSLLIIQTSTHDHSYTFTGLSDPSAAGKFIREIWEKQKGVSEDSPNVKVTSAAPLTNRSDVGSPHDLQPTEEDWALILKGAVIQTYKRNEPIISEGTPSYALYQVVGGKTRIEKKGVDSVLGYIGAEDGVFGQISFLEGGSATASVIADEDGTSVNIIQAFFLNILFQHYPHLAGRFYHYLAGVLASTIIERRSDEDEGDAPMETPKKKKHRRKEKKLSGVRLSADSATFAKKDRERDKDKEKEKEKSDDGKGPRKHRRKKTKTDDAKEAVSSDDDAS